MTQKSCAVGMRNAKLGNHLKPRSPTVFYTVYKRAVRGAVASWLVLSTPERAVRVRALAGDIASVVFLGKTLYSHSSSLHPLVQMGTGKLSGKSDKLRGMTCDGLASRPGEVEILLAASCYRNRDKHGQL